MFSKEQIEKLKKEYSKIKKIDPSLPTYDKLISFIDKLDKVKLQQLADEKVPWLGILANNRLIKMKHGVK